MRPNTGQPCFNPDTVQRPATEASVWHEDFGAGKFCRADPPRSKDDPAFPEQQICKTSETCDLLTEYMGRIGGEAKVQDEEPGRLALGVDLGTKDICEWMWRAVLCLYLGAEFPETPVRNFAVFHALSLLSSVHTCIPSNRRWCLSTQPRKAAKERSTRDFALGPRMACALACGLANWVSIRAAEGTALESLVSEHCDARFFCVGDAALAAVRWLTRIGRQVIVAGRDICSHHTLVMILQIPSVPGRKMGKTWRP